MIKNQGQSGSGPVQGLQWARGSRRIQGPRLTKLRKTAFRGGPCDEIIWINRPHRQPGSEIGKTSANGHAMLNQSTRKFCLQVNAKDLVSHFLCAKLGENYSEESMLDVIVAAYLLSNPLAKILDLMQPP